MSDIEDDGFNEEAFRGLEDEGTPAPAVTPPETTPPATPPTTTTPPAGGDGDDPPKVDPPKPADPDKKEEPPKADEGTPPAPTGDEKKPEETAKPPETPATPSEPAAPETPQPLTKDDIKEVVTDLITGERASGKELETATSEVLEAYYPEGLSNVLIDEKTQKPLRTPQDVVDASGGEMTMEAAASWLMNEQAKVDLRVNEIKEDARKVAETTINFKRDSMTVLQKYEPLFKAYPHLQKKSFDLMMKQVKVDKDKGVILQAPDVIDLYDTYLEPWQTAYEYSTKQSATNPTAPATPPPATPSAEDRLDEGGDAGPTPVDDPNDFAAAVTKELA